MAARQRKTDYASKAFKHREHRSKKGRSKNYKETKKQRQRRLEQEDYIERKRKKFHNNFST